jgi:hypothetical protein
MARKKRVKRCAWCGENHTRRGKYCCKEHGEAALKECIKQLKKKEGAIYERWKIGITRGV